MTSDLLFCFRPQQGALSPITKDGTLQGDVFQKVGTFDKVPFNIFFAVDDFLQIPMIKRADRCHQHYGQINDRIGDH